MELEQLQERWRQLDQKLDRTLAMHSDVLRQMSLQRARRRINRLAVWPVIDLIFGVAVLLVSGAFLGDHWPEPTLVILASGLMIAAVVFLIDNIRQLMFVSEVSWDGPIACIQLALSRLRHARVRQFKWIILLSPLLGFCMMTVGGKLVLGLNIIESFDPWWVAGNIAFGFLFIPAGVMIARILRRRWQGHPFWQGLLDDISGRSLVTTQRNLNQWAELGNEASA